VNLVDLAFQTSGTEVPLAEIGQAGNPLPDPQVTLNGAPLSLNSDYYVPPGYTLQFLFPDTTDPFFIVEGDVFADGAFQPLARIGRRTETVSRSCAWWRARSNSSTRSARALPHRGLVE
jgi:hypothetical protein